MAGSPLIFIAYFGPDKARAKTLHRALTEAEFSAWCDTDLVPGDLWDVVIPAKLSEARIVVVLLSRPDHDGWYARSDIARAIAAARKTDGRVVPVLLDGVTPEDAPYGLSRVAGIPAGDGDWPFVVSELKRVVAVMDANSTDRTSPPRRSVDPPPAPPPARLGIDQNALVDAVIRRRLDRDLLLSWVPDGITARLPQQRSYFDQMTSDIKKLVDAGRLADGQWAIGVWLRQAERLAGPFAEARVFRDALAKLP